MIIPDVNLLLYAYNSAAPTHEAARDWWADCCNSRREVGLPWAVAMGFIRLTTVPRVTPRPLAPAVATDIVRDWLDRSHIEILTPGPRHLDILAELFAALGVAGRLTTDAHLAALAIEYNAELHSVDVDFARMPGLRWQNPLPARK